MVAIVLITLIVLLIVSFLIYHNKGEKSLYCERSYRILVANYNAVMCIHACVTLKCTIFLACMHCTRLCQICVSALLYHVYVSGTTCWYILLYKQCIHVSVYLLGKHNILIFHFAGCA